VVGFVEGTPGRVAEDLVGLGYLSEPPGCVRVVGVRVRMRTVGEAAVGASDLFLRGGPGDLEPQVEVVRVMMLILCHNLMLFLVDLKLPTRHITYGHTIIGLAVISAGPWA
jgi:hypothetical protein